MRRMTVGLPIVALIFPVAVWAQIANIVVTSGASFQPGLPPPGSIGTIFCTGLNLSGVVSATQTPLPTTLAGVSVAVGGAPAPLFAVADTGPYQQINFQVPLTSIGSAGVQVVVSQNTAQGSVTATYDPNAPGDFFRTGATQFGIFQHGSDFSLVTPDNPAKAGETIVGYATGLPLAAPTVPAGLPAPPSPLSYVPQFDFQGFLNLIGLSFNGSEADLRGAGCTFNGPCTLGTVLMDDPGSSCVDCDTTGQPPIPFMGLAPGAVGVYQVNFVIPAGLPPGNITILFLRASCSPMPGLTCSAGGAVRYYGGQPVLLPVG